MEYCKDRRQREEERERESRKTKERRVSQDDKIILPADIFSSTAGRRRGPIGPNQHPRRFPAGYVTIHYIRHCITVCMSLLSNAA
jgi:hypothetical protein